MNGQINQLVKTLLQKESIDQCTVQELQQFADRHPYFGAAQLLLTKKLKTENSANYNEQLQKTFLFFHNPLWVENLLSDAGHATITTVASSSAVDTPAEIESTPVKAVIDGSNEVPAVVNTFVEQKIDEPAGTDQEEMAPEISTGEMPLSVAEEIQPDQFTQPATVENTGPATDFIEPPATSPSTEEITPPENASTANPAFREELLFEPFHTVDYFASQGIKIREEEKPQDKLGRQLKSFTAWLKTMKRLPVTELSPGVNPVIEQKVEQMAEHSIQGKEIVTEAMAEVWEKQGNTAKALEVYNKLSLLDPSKNAYFAAKIEELKKTN